MRVKKTSFGTVAFSESDDLEQVAQAIAGHVKDPLRDAILALVDAVAMTNQRLDDTCQAIRDAAAESAAMMKQSEGTMNKHHAETQKAQSETRTAIAAIVEELRKPVVPVYDSRGKLIGANRI